MNMQRSFYGTYSFFFHKFFAYCFYFTFTQLSVVHWSAFCFNKNNFAIFTKKALMTRIIFSLLGNFFSTFFTIIRTLFILTYCFIFTSGSSHENHLMAKVK